MKTQKIAAIALIAGVSLYATSTLEAKGHYEGKAGHTNLTPAEFQVRASVVGSCLNDVSAADLDFGEYNPLDDAAKEGDTNIHVTCTKGATYWVNLSAGANSQDVTQRKMKGGPNNTELHYSLRTVSGTEWDTEQFTADGTNTIPVHGILHPNQHQIDYDGNNSLYSDTITVTVSY